MRKTQAAQGFAGTYTPYIPKFQKNIHPSKNSRPPLRNAMQDKQGVYIFLEFWNFGILGQKARKIKGLRHSSYIPVFKKLECNLCFVMVKERQRKRKNKEKKKDRKTQAIALSGDGIWARHGTEAAGRQEHEGACGKGATRGPGE